MSIQRIGIIGAGQMGSGIAQLGAQAGFDMFLLDQNPEGALRAQARIERTLAGLVEKGKLDDASRASALTRVNAVLDYEALSNCDLIIEAVVEHARTKCEILRKAEAVARPDAILASNTSSISITTLAASTRRPERVIGMHFMNPPPVMRLVEIIRGLQTSDDTAERTKQVTEKMGKVVVSARDMPGFIVNRMLIPFLNEACFALQEGLGTPEDIDTGAKLGLNHPMGPLELADLIGLDTVLYIAEVLHRELGDDKYRPPTILRNHVSAGWLGRKTGRGFHRYPR